MKLGFRVRITKGGYNECKPINDGPWVRYTSDIRSLIHGLDDFEGMAREAVVLRFLGKDGFLVGLVMTAGGGRMGDNITAWVHVPAEMRISGQELEKVINDIKGEIKKEFMGVDDIRESCLKFFEEDYGRKTAQHPVVERLISRGIDSDAQDGVETAGMYYGDYQMYELLGEYIAQPEYGKWSGIFLVDKSSGIKIRNRLVLNKLRKTIVFSLPDSMYGFVSSFRNPDYQGGNEVEMLEGERIDILWGRSGYQVVPKSITISRKQEENQVQAQLQPSDIKFGVKRSWFRVVDEDGNDISGKCSIKVNTFELLPGDETTYVSAQSEYELVVSCHGYNAGGEEEHKEKFSSFSGQIPLIRLKTNPVTETYTLPKDDGVGLSHDAKITIETKQPYGGMPIRGYEVDGGNIKYNDFIKSWTKIKWFLIGALVVAAIWGISAGARWFGEKYYIDKEPWFIHQRDESPKGEKVKVTKPGKGNKGDKGKNNGDKDGKDNGAGQSEGIEGEAVFPEGGETDETVEDSGMNENDMAESDRSK